MSWHNAYLAALQARDKREQANRDVFDAYTKLADRTAQLARSKQSQQTPAGEERPRAASRKASSPDPVALSTLKADLIEAQARRGELQMKLDKVTQDLEKQISKNKEDELRVRQLTADKSILARRLKDRDEELRGKAKLLDEVQEEGVALTLQLNVTEQQNDKLKQENKQLVDRWMARMGDEADRMNLESKFT